MVYYWKNKGLFDFRYSGEMSIQALRKYGNFKYRKKYKCYELGNCDRGLSISDSGRLYMYWCFDDFDFLPAEIMHCLFKMIEDKVISETRLYRFHYKYKIGKGKCWYRQEVLCESKKEFLEHFKGLDYIHKEIINYKEYKNFY